MADFDHLAAVMGSISKVKKKKLAKLQQKEAEAYATFLDSDMARAAQAVKLQSAPSPKTGTSTYNDTDISQSRSRPTSPKSTDTSASPPVSPTTNMSNKEQRKQSKIDKKIRKAERKKAKKASSPTKSRTPPPSTSSPKAKDKSKSPKNGRARGSGGDNDVRSPRRSTGSEDFPGFDDVAASGGVPEIDRNKLVFEREIGQGAFGVVVKGILKSSDGSSIMCACKTLKDSSNKDALAELEAEAKLAWSLRHPNIVACLGQVTVGDPWILLLEFMSNGSLMSYLLELPQLPKLQRLMKMAIDIARGMEHLVKEGNIHRDLATRNVLVNEEMTCKIADFGLTRAMDEDMYYQSEGGMVAVRWAAPEAYKFKKYSAASDVWSYGISLYEIWTKAALPYGKKWTNMNVMLKVEEGFRLPAPPGCPKAVYQLMMQCWNPRRKLRPTFASIRERLEMAHDMLFPEATNDDDDNDDDGYISVNGIDEGIEGMDQMYLGLAVPTEADLDNTEDYEYLSMPTPVKSQAAKTSGQSVKSPSTIMAEVRARESVPKHTNVSVKPDRFTIQMLKSPTKSSGSGSSTPQFVRSPTTGEIDLRKQRAAHEVVNELAQEPVERTRVRSVAEMIVLSRSKETQSFAESTGLLTANQAGIDAKKVEYIESVGRAVDVTPLSQGRAGGRKRCTCRRAKCVCGAR